MGDFHANVDSNFIGFVVLDYCHHVLQNFNEIPCPGEMSRLTQYKF